MNTRIGRRVADLEDELRLLKERLHSLWPRWPLFYVLLFLVAFLISLLRLPIVARDTDLWYHLNAGRYILANKAIPHEAFFSFLRPPRPWVDYYWFFQTLVYGIYSLSGYWGLIIFRAAAFGVMGSLIGFYFLKDHWPQTPLYESLLVSAYLLTLTPRFIFVRPHIFEFIFMTLAIIILDSRRSWAIFLPLIAALWGNLHGVSYPMLLLICGAYIAEYFSNRYFRPEETTGQQKTLAFCALAMAAVFLTPLGADLVDQPFTSLSYAQAQINELAAFGIKDFGSLGIMRWLMLPDTAFNLLFMLAVLSGIIAMSKFKTRASHLILLAGGIFALLKNGARFQYECLLLAMPLLRAAPPFARGIRRFLPPPLKALALAGFALTAHYAVRETLRNDGRRPLSLENLPHGVIAFLRHVNVGGKILNEPNAGGYWQWMLYPRYLIAADMQFPFLFNDLDYYHVHYAFYSEALLRRFIANYHPDFISAPVWAKDFPGIIRHFANYVLVFYDDTHTLYASRRAHPDLVKKYGLPSVPFASDSLPLPPEQSEPPKKDGLPPYAKLKRMISIDPHSIITRFQAARICALHGDSQGELSQAEMAISENPAHALGYVFKGDALQRMGRLHAALDALQKALDRADASSKKLVLKRMVIVYMSLGAWPEAFSAMNLWRGGIVPDGYINEKPPGTRP